MLAGFGEKPRPVLFCRKEAEISSLGKRSALYLMLAILCTGCAVGLGVIWLLRSQVLNRIRLLQADLRKVQNDSGASRLLALPGQDEVSELALSINRTLSSLLETEAALRRQEEAVQQSQRIQSLGVLAAGVAHEINNPLHSLQLNLGVFRRMMKDGTSGLPGETEEILGDLEQEVRNIAGIVSRMRDLARPAGSDDVAPLELNSAVGEALSVVRAQMASHAIAMEEDFASDLPGIMASGHDLKQAIINLIANARQALDQQKGGRIVVRTADCDGAICLQVEDNGPGLPANPDRVFDPFFSTKEVGEGMGMGLAVIYNQVTRWGGKIEAASGALGGACFTISFRKADDEDPAGG